MKELCFIIYIYIYRSTIMVILANSIYNVIDQGPDIAETMRS